MVFYDVLMISPVIKIRLGEENLNYWKPAWLTEMEAARSESGHNFLGSKETLLFCYLKEAIVLPSSLIWNP